MAVSGDLLVDGESKRESGTTGFGWHAGLCAGANGVKKVFDLKAKGFAFGDVGPGEGEAGGGVYDASERGRLAVVGGVWRGVRGGDRDGCRDRG